MDEFGDTVDRAEVDRFAAQSAGWWDPEGSFRPLHRINHVRLDFIRRQLVAAFGRDASALRPFDDLSLVDIGCGGGLIAEPMARLGFTVTGIDLALDPQRGMLDALDIGNRRTAEFLNDARHSAQPSRTRPRPG